MKPLRLTAVRKSSRAAAKEPPDEKGHIQPLGRRRSYRRRNSGNQIPANEEARMYAIRRAEELQSSLGLDSPSFVKSMMHSHVKVCFWLNIHASFAKSHLPKHDEYITLRDEDGHESTTKYLVQNHGLSGGWKRFAIDHKLVDGDALVFQLIQPTTFKVYIVRVNDVVIHPKETDFNGRFADKNRGIDGAANEQGSSYVPPAVVQGNANETDPLLRNPNIQQRLDLSVEEKGSIHSSFMEDFPLSGRVPDFENFKIIVNGECIDREFTKQARADYYSLCHSQKSYLHKNLLKSISGSLAVGIITKTVNMANAIRACKLSSPTDDFEMWVKTLVAFELMGMDVAFIRDRLNRLVSLASESKVIEELKRYEEERNKRDRTEEEIMSLELKLMKLKHDKGRHEDEMVAIRVNLHKYESVFEETASAPW